MVELNFQADPNFAVEEPRDFPLLPDGEYKAMITGATVRGSQKDSRNTYLSVEFSIEQDGAGRVWSNLNLWNVNDEAVRIAKQELNSICLAIGVMNMTDTEQMIGQRLLVDITTKPAQGDYKARNETKGYKPLEKSVQPSAPQVTTQTEVAAPTPVAQHPSAPQEKKPWD